LLLHKSIWRTEVVSHSEVSNVGLLYELELQLIADSLFTL